VSESDLVPGPIEQRLRRTFAARAEDMAPGDGAAGDQGIQLVLAQSADRAHERHRDHGPGRFQLVAAIVVIVGLGLAAIGVVVANDEGDGDETGDLTSDGSGEPHAPDVALITAPRDLVTALQDERNLATIELIGAADAMAPAVDDTEEARSRTDTAATAFDSVVAADPAGSAYQAALDRLDGLGALRGDIDAYDGPRTLDNVDLATEAFNRYSDMIGGLLDSQGEATQLIDDPDLQAGARMYLLGLRQHELTAQLGRAAVLNAVSPSSPTLTELSRLYGLVNQGHDDLLAQATGTPYEAPATTVIDQIEASGLLDTVATALQGTTDLSHLLAAVNLPEDQGWPAFLDRVEQLLATTP
jgi:hypothetical protein